MASAYAIITIEAYLMRLATSLYCDDTGLIIARQWN